MAKPYQIRKREARRAGRTCEHCGTLIEHLHALRLRCDPCQKALQEKRMLDWLHKQGKTVTGKKIDGTRRERRQSTEPTTVWPDDPEERRLLRNQKMREYRANNPEQFKEYDRKRQSKRNAQTMERYRNDPEFRQKMIDKVTKRAESLGFGYRRLRNIRTILNRDGVLCTYCGEFLTDPFDGQSTHVDHIQPASKGGTNALENLQLLHARCNIQKGNR